MLPSPGSWGAYLICIFYLIDSLMERQHLDLQREGKMYVKHYFLKYSNQSFTAGKQARTFRTEQQHSQLTKKVSAECLRPATPGRRRWRSPPRSGCAECRGTGGCRARRRRTPWPPRRPRPPAAAWAPAATPGRPAPCRGRAGRRSG